MKKAVSYVLDFFVIATGCALLAIGLDVFLVPNLISSGGVSTIGTVIFHLFEIKLSVTVLVINATLFIIGFKFLPKYSLVKTVEGIFLFSFFLETSSYLPAYTSDALIATLSGGVLMGLGVGLTVRRGASTGGSDFAALIIKRFLPHLSIASVIFFIDSVIIIAAGITFGSFEITAYSLTSMFISSKVTDSIVTLGSSAKTVRIFSSKNDVISEKIIKIFHRGVTRFPCRGMYSGVEGNMLLCVISVKELPPLIAEIKRTDMNAFVVINDAKEVLGEGFKNITSYGNPK